MKGKEFIIKLTDPYSGQTFEGNMKQCIKMLKSGENVAAIFLYDFDNIDIEVAEETKSQLGAVSQRAFVNIYEDEDGERFISREDYSEFQHAFEMRDEVSTYVETVEIVRHDG